MTFFERLREVRELPASARYESTTKEMLTVDPNVQPKPNVSEGGIRDTDHAEEYCWCNPWVLNLG